MKREEESPLYFLKQGKSVHWFLFGVNRVSKKIYFLEIIGNDSTQTRILSLQGARYIWKTLINDGVERVELRDVPAIPSHVDQRIREWWKFVNNNFLDRLHGEDPWGSLEVEGDSPETLTKIAGDKITSLDDHGPSPTANFWEYREKDDEVYPSESRTNHPEEGGDFDNYWNQEGVFEEQSDMQHEF